MAEAAASTRDLPSASLPAIRASFRQLSDFFLLAEGGYEPVSRFLGSRETASVCRTMHLTTGEPWSMPIVFPVDDSTRERVVRADSVEVWDADGPAGLLHVEEVFEIDKQTYADCIFRTSDEAHPGITWLRKCGRYALAGPVEASRGWELGVPGRLPISPRDTARMIRNRGWRKVVGFQTRNPIHRAHEYCTKIALETADGLVIHPVLGETKGDDTPVHVRLACYETLLSKYYPAQHAMLAGFPGWMRYAGPREAVFHAQVRRNYGITHFIVGRDHAGLGNYYGPFDAQRIFSEFLPGELGIETIFFDFVHYCERCGCMASKKTCPHGPEHHLHLTGRALRRMLAEGSVPPPEYTRPEVARILVEAARRTA
ncbi:MAG: sulfate adenylyltransferase [Bryobacterales bacterium]|nr:sulfate adenylyltransferase [Bryobacterales bacterium]